MRNCFSSLQFRLILGFALVLALSLGSVGTYVAFAAQKKAEEFDRKIGEVRDRRLEHLVSGSYSRHQNGGEFQSTLEQAGNLFDRRIVVTDQEGKIVGDSLHRHGKPMLGSPGGRHFPLKISGEEVGSIILAPSDAPDMIPDPLVTQVAADLNRSLIWTGLAVGSVGIIMISLVSRRILVPVQALSSAAQRLGRGDLSQRVSIHGPEEIKRLALTFNTMAENLQKAERQRRNLVADVAHELRTPVSNIQIYLETIEDGFLGTDEAIDKIRRQASHLTTLIEDLRLLSMAEAGNLRLNLEPCSLEELLSQSVENARPGALAKGVELEMRIRSGLPLVPVDRTRISQVVGNLLENSILHTPIGGTITVLAQADADEIKVTVADTGEGIPESALPFVFDRFYRADPSRTRDTGGTGLGLSIVKQLVEAHGGNVHVESVLGQGSSFTFQLPLAPSKGS
jgi:signal transduction histidine kinase